MSEWLQECSVRCLECLTLGLKVHYLVYIFSKDCLPSWNNFYLFSLIVLFLIRAVLLLGRVEWKCCCYSFSWSIGIFWLRVDFLCLCVVFFRVRSAFRMRCWWGLWRRRIDQRGSYLFVFWWIRINLGNGGCMLFFILSFLFDRTWRFRGVSRLSCWGCGGSFSLFIFFIDRLIMRDL